MNMLAALLIVAGALLLGVAAWGLIVLPDALARQHAATKAGTLALATVILGAMAANPEPQWIWRLGLMLVFLLLTLPVASHLLARAAVRESGTIDAARRDAEQLEPRVAPCAPHTSQRRER